MANYTVNDAPIVTIRRCMEVWLAAPNFVGTEADKAKFRNCVLASLGVEPLNPAHGIPASELPGILAWVLKTVSVTLKRAPVAGNPAPPKCI